MNDHGELIAGVNEYYVGKLREHGSTFRGVDWNSRDSQVLRFARLMDLVDEPTEPYSLIDYGCGYGELVSWLADRGDQVDYAGFDSAPEMVEAARDLHPSTRFEHDRALLEPAQFCVASGLFNLRLDNGVEAWERYVWECVDDLARLSTRAFSFNVLTGWSDPERCRDDLFYAPPGRFLDECARRYGRHVALRHDYGLWEFTITVRHL